VAFGGVVVAMDFNTCPLLAVLLSKDRSAGVENNIVLRLMAELVNKIRHVILYKELRQKYKNNYSLLARSIICDVFDGDYFKVYQINVLKACITLFTSLLTYCICRAITISVRFLYGLM
jgi:hypothetical protein